MPRQLTTHRDQDPVGTKFLDNLWSDFHASKLKGLAPAEIALALSALRKALQEWDKGAPGPGKAPQSIQEAAKSSVSPTPRVPYGVMKGLALAPGIAGSGGTSGPGPREPLQSPPPEARLT